MPNSCLIVGAGLSGLTAAAELQKAGWLVTILEKSRGPGGRMATRRFSGGVFDHGAQFFTARSPEFQKQVDGWIAQNQARLWSNGFGKPDGHPRYRGAQSMNAIPKQIAAGLQSKGVVFSYETKVETVSFDGRRWTADRFTADTLLLTPPVPQTLQLLEQSQIEIDAQSQETLSQLRYERCVSLLLQSSEPTPVPPPGAVAESNADQPISFLADNFQKQISPIPGSLTIHTSAQEAETCWDLPDEEIVTRLHTQAERLIAAPIPVEAAQVHRWRYSKPIDPLNSRALLTLTPGPLVFAGDAFSDAKVEGAFTSGREAARLLTTA